MILICLDENNYNFYINEKLTECVKVNSCLYYLLLPGHEGHVKITRN